MTETRGFEKKRVVEVGGEGVRVSERLKEKEGERSKRERKVKDGVSAGSGCIWPSLDVRMVGP